MKPQDKFLRTILAISELSNNINDPAAFEIPKDIFIIESIYQDLPRSSIQIIYTAFRNHYFRILQCVVKIHLNQCTINDVYTSALMLFFITNIIMQLVYKYVRIFTSTSKLIDHCIII